MALSVIVYPGDGVTTQFSIPFALGYIKESDITARVGNEQDGAGNPIYRTLTFLSPTSVVVSGTPAPLGTNIVFQRTVERDQLIVDYEDGDIINEDNMNTAQKQAIMLVHEVLDGRFSQFQSGVDLGGFRITGLGNPIAATDGANKQYVDSRIATGEGSAAAAAASAAQAAGSAAAAGGAASAAGISSTNAFKWASEQEDVPVNDGVRTGYSAFHWASKAALFNPSDYLRSSTWLSTTITTKEGNTSTPAIKFGQIGLSPRDFNPLAGTGAIDDTTAVQAALDYVMSNGGTVDLDGIWNVTKISIGLMNNYFEITGRAVFHGNTTVAQNALLEITRGNFDISGSITVFGKYNSLYASGIWYHNDTQIQAAALDKLIAIGCLIGFRLGDAAFGASVTSETTISLPRTYGCPIGMQVEGYNTFLTVNAPPVISGDGFGGDAAWQARPRHAIVTKGVGSLTILGGEVIQTGSGLATNHNILMLPSVTSGVLYYGRITLIGVCVETGGPMVTVQNPTALTGAEDVGRPRITFIGCVGYHSQNNAPLVSTPDDFIGDVVWTANNVWFPGTRTQPNMQVGVNTHVYMDDIGIGKGFLSTMRGVTGGVLHFSNRMIVRAIGPTAIALTAPNAYDIVYSAKDHSGDSLKFNTSSYNSTTGEFTIPAGSFRTMRLFATLRTSTGISGRLIFRENGTEVHAAPFINGVGQVTYARNEPVVGTKYTVALVVDTGTGSVESTGYLSSFEVEASR